MGTLIAGAMDILEKTMKLKILALLVFTCGIAAASVNSAQRNVRASYATKTALAGVSGSANAIQSAIEITSGAPPSGIVGTTYGGSHVAPGRERYTGFVLNVTGGVAPFAWSWAAARGSSLPPGLSISQVFFGGSTRCCFSAVVISGDPTKAGVYRVIVTVTDSESPAVHTSAVYAITIDAASEAATVEASPASAAPMVDSDSRQQYHHYKLVDMGTFGGPESHINGFEYQGAAQNVDNGGSLAGWADTSMPDPFASSGNAFGNFCFNTDCFVSHAFQFQNGVTTDLGTLPGGLNSASSWISSNGFVAGTSQDGELDPLDAGFPEDQAVVWEKGKIISLGNLPEGGYESGGQAVNSHGQAVGWAFNTVPDPNSLGMLSPFYDYYEPVYAYQMRAFLWENGGMKDLGTLGTGTDAWAMAINDKGQVMGISYTNATPNQVMTGCSSGAPMPTQDPFLWERGKMTDLGTLGGTCGTPFWMNDSGEIVGASDLAGDENAHAFLWTEASGMQDLGTLGGSNSAASMVNDSGVVVGGSFVAGGGNFHAFLWDGTMQDLGTLGGCAYAFSINAKGQVVGNGGGGCETTSFLWEGVGPMADLNALVSPHVDLLVTGALNINDSGEIAGQATDMSGHSSAILLIPCDENHPNIEGCDYSMVDAATANEYQSPLQVAAPPAPAGQGTVSPVEMMLRVRSMTASRNRRLGASPQQ
jgi:probable HAF family extracellular repeat protein